MNLVRDVKIFGTVCQSKGENIEAEELALPSKHMNFLTEAHEAYEAPEAEAHDAHETEALEAPEAHEAQDGRVQRGVPQMPYLRAWRTSSIVSTLKKEEFIAPFNIITRRMGHKTPFFLGTRKMEKWGRKPITASRA
jgi:hypothetical protein